MNPTPLLSDLDHENDDFFSQYDSELLKVIFGIENEEGSKLSALKQGVAKHSFNLELGIEKEFHLHNFLELLKNKTKSKKGKRDKNSGFRRFVINALLEYYEKYGDDYL